MSDFDEIRDENLDFVRETLAPLVNVPPLSNKKWEAGRAAFLTTARQIMPEPVSPAGPGRLNNWTTRINARLNQVIPIRKEINMTGLITIIMTLSVVFALGAGGVDAAQTSLPGSPLYPIRGIYLFDSTCRSYFGFTPKGNEPGLCP